ncbi:hypothetical protein [Fibrisoma limi]|uniref:hypothetical protein n=1 Tax=Fibrisoma limi TaxID=663275 RepID=UPI00058732E3|nr:hypothetical protein [Fibrisoma limi]
MEKLKIGDPVMLTSDSRVMTVVGFDKLTALRTKDQAIEDLPDDPSQPICEWIDGQGRRLKAIFGLNQLTRIY